MESYYVNVIFTHTYCVKVEASSEAEALELAMDEASDISYNVMECEINTEIL